jgi:hypothetical protein
MRKTYFTALFIAVGIIGWIASGLLEEGAAPVPQTISAKNAQQRAQSEDQPLTSVRVMTSYAVEQNRLTSVRGQTTNERSVLVQSQVGMSFAKFQSRIEMQTSKRLWLGSRKPSWI